MSGTVTIFAEADAYVRRGTPDENYGSATFMKVDGAPKFRSFLRFTVPSSAGIVRSARLRLYPLNGSTDGGTLYSIQSGWEEQSITWATSPAAGAAVASLGPVARAAWTDLDLSDHISGPGTYSFVLVTTSEDAGTYSTREGPARKRPRLIVSEDGGPPSAPQNLVATAPAPSRVQLTWDPSSDDVGVAGYEVMRDGVAVASVSTPGFTDTEVAGGASHRYAVAAFDAAGNRSGPSNTATVKTPLPDPVFPEADAYVSGAEGERDANFGLAETLRVDTEPKRWETYVRFVVPGDVGPIQRVGLRLFAFNESDLGGTVHEVADDGWGETTITWNNRPAAGATAGEIGPVPVNAWIEIDLTEVVPGPGTYSFAISTTSDDSSRYWSGEFSDPNLRPRLKLYPPDTTAPSPPSGLAATAASPFRVDLSWTASEDDQGVAGYEVLREGMKVGATPGTAYVDGSARSGRGYSYTVRAVDAAGNESPTSEPAGATTPGFEGDPVVMAAGDIACDPVRDANFNGGEGHPWGCRMKATSDLVLGVDPAAVLLLGDTQYEFGEPSAYERSYDPSWGRTAAVTYPAPGNHEYNYVGAAGYYGYFGAAAGDPAKGYYSFDIGAWHVVSLNSNCDHVECGPGSDQERWLRADLAAHPADCTLAYWHHPRFASQNAEPHAWSAAFWEALYEAGADLVLNGHMHSYQRFGPQTPGGVDNTEKGIVQFVVGTGGKNHYAGGSATTNLVIENNDTFGVLKLTLRDHGYEWKFLPVVEDGGGTAFTDSGSAACH